MVDSLDTLDFTSITGDTFSRRRSSFRFRSSTPPRASSPTSPTSSASSSGRSSIPKSSRSRARRSTASLYPQGLQSGRRRQADSVAAEAAFRLRSARRAVHAQRPDAQIPAAAQTAGAGADQRPDPGRHLLAHGPSCRTTDRRRTNISAQQKLPDGWYMDRPNIIYSSHNRPVMTSADPDATKGLSVHSFLSVSGGVYNIEESGSPRRCRTTRPADSLISTVSSVANMLVAVLFDYDNNDLGRPARLRPRRSPTRAWCSSTAIWARPGYSFSSPDHFDVNDVLPSQVPLLDQVADLVWLRRRLLQHRPEPAAAVLEPDL